MCDHVTLASKSEADRYIIRNERSLRVVDHNSSQLIFVFLTDGVLDRKYWTVGDDIEKCFIV